MILLLTLAGAGVDAMVIMGFNVLTAAQTGNTILLSVAVARGDFVTGLSAAVSVVGFVFGAAVGELFIIRHSDSGRGPSGIVGTLLAEIALLGALYPLWRMAGGSPSQTMALELVTLAAVAMGIQSAAVRRLHKGPTTTYITGVLTSFTTGMVRSWQAKAGPSVRQTSQAEPASGDSPWKYGLVWSIYVAGAIGGGLLYLNVGALALLLPISAVAGVILLDPRHW